MTTELLAIGLSGAVSLLFSRCLHPDTGFLSILSFALLVLSFCVGPIYLSIKLMGPIGLIAFIALPLLMASLAKKDTSRWVFLSGETRTLGSKLDPIVFWITILGLLSYSAYQLSAAWLMGDHESSYWIFNVDNGVRTELAWRVAKADAFPPDQLLSEEAYGTFYHYGSVALGSLFSGLFGDDVASTYLRLTIPVMLIPAVLAPTLLIYSRTKSKKLIVLPLLIMSLHFVEGLDFSMLRSFGYELWNITHGVLERDWKVVQDVVISTRIHGSAQSFGNLVLDGANASILSFSALVMAGIVGLRRNALGLLIVGLWPIALMMNTRLGFSAAVLVGTSLLMAGSGGKVRNLLIFSAFVILSVFLFRYYRVEVELISTGFGKAIGFNPEENVALAFGSYIVIVIISLLLMLTLTTEHQNKAKGSGLALGFEHYLFLSSFLIILSFGVTQPVVNNHYNLYSHQVREFLEPTVLLWTVFVFILFTLSRGRESNSGTRRSLGQRLGGCQKGLANLLIVLGAIWVFFDGYHANVQNLKLWFWPYSGQDAVDFIDFKNCLDETSSDPILATNSGRYPADDYHRSKQFLGHLHLKGDLRARQAGSEGIDLLSRPDASAEQIRAYFDQIGVTDLLIDKNQSWALSLNEHFIYSNDTCALIDVERLPTR